MASDKQETADLYGADWYVAAEQRCERKLRLIGLEGHVARAVANLALDLCIAGYRRGVADAMTKSTANVAITWSKAKR